MLRYFIAFLAAPLPAALLQALVVAIRPRPGLGILHHPASMFVAFCLLLYILGLIVGVPAYLLLRRGSPVSLRTHAFAGGLMTAIPTGLVRAWALALGGSPALEAVSALLWFGLLGLLSGTAFWLVARPDRRVGKRRLLKTFE